LQLLSACRSSRRRFRPDCCSAAAETRPSLSWDGTTLELTERELEVFRLIARGHSNVEIGRELYISAQRTSIRDERPAR
jgi:DNA-binding NarL/FixJ family response regulator